MCDAHFLEWKQANALKSELVCSVVGCERATKAKGFCLMHHARWAKTGDPGGPDRRAKATGDGYTSKSNGYRYVYVPTHPNSAGDGLIMEHRILMSESLGRPLGKLETVHHKNGIRSDNRIKMGHELGGCPPTCCNLELWTKSQPAGQRVIDKVAWAKEILALYGDGSSVAAE